MRATVPAYCEGPSARSRLSWVLLDWGASSYSTIQITVMVAYVKAVFKAHNPWPVSPAAVWAWTLGLAMLMSATLTPIAAGWADRYGRHRAALAFSVLTGSLACIGLGLAPPTWPATTVTLVAISAVGFDLAAIFTGALLPAVAAGSFTWEANSVASLRAWGLGSCTNSAAGPAPDCSCSSCSSWRGGCSSPAFRSTRNRMRPRLSRQSRARLASSSCPASAPRETPRPPQPRAHSNRGSRPAR
jgi:MFS family permease